MRITAIALLLGALGLAACDSSSDVTIVPNVLTGTFVLQSVNGVALPATVVDSAVPPFRIVALSGTITINADNTFADVNSFQQTLGTAISTRTVSCTGTYTLVGTVFQFVEATPAPNCGRTFTGVITGTTLSASVLGVPAVFVQ